MPRNRRLPGKTGTVSSRTSAMQLLKLTKTQADRSRQLFKQLAFDLHGVGWATVLTPDEHAALCRKTASAMRKESGKPVSTDQVRKAVPLARNKPEVPTGHPVDLEADLHAFLARRSAEGGGTMKALASAYLRAGIACEAMQET